MTQSPNDFHDPLGTKQQDPIATDSLDHKDPPPWKDLSPAFLRYLALAAMVVLYTLVSPSKGAVFEAAIVVIVLVAIKAVWNIVRRSNTHPLRKVLAAVIVSAASLVGVAIAWVMLLLATTSTGSCGRPFRRRGRPLVAQVATDTDWLQPQEPTPACRSSLHRASTPVTLPLQLPDDLQQALAQVYCEEARAEHASIAAFSHLSLQLLALGAPPALLNSTHHAALDEVRHARTFFSLASTYSKEPVSAGLFPQALLPPPAWPTDRAAQLVRLAQESVLDGCLGEGVAAALLAEGSRCAVQSSLAATLADIAEDEQRHTELAWDIVTWALTKGGAPVALALQQTLAGWPEVAPPPYEPPGGTVLQWQAHGKIFGAKAQALYTQTQKAVAARLTALLLPFAAARCRHAA